MNLVSGLDLVEISRISSLKHPSKIDLSGASSQKKNARNTRKIDLLREFLLQKKRQPKPWVAVLD